MAEQRPEQNEKDPSILETKDQVKVHSGIEIIEKIQQRMNAQWIAKNRPAWDKPHEGETSR